MIIEIDDLELEPLHVQHVYEPGQLAFDHADAALAAPVTTDFVLTHKERDLQVGGTVRTSIRYTCSRCLKEYVKPLAATFDLSYLPQPNAGNDEVALKYEDMDVGFYDGIGLDVDLMVNEQIELAMPMKFVCRDECRGLCARCGADLNQGPCLCPQDPTDSRLAVLLDFRKKLGPTE